MKLIVQGEFEGKAEPAITELIVLGNHGGGNRGAKVKNRIIGKVIKLDEVNRAVARIDAGAAKEICGGGAGEVEEPETELEGIGLGGIWTRGDVEHAEIEGHRKVVAFGQGGAQ